ncbi:copper resistance CopC family protein [Oceanobacillus bengalensis]|uniref:copper resistance CopC family protein n=1 Tax=Oceanobacillus bengalensis TaxID=1435466 RepID=UPI001600B473|nr:copper resistance protein CopC [Oceanobacillus bengalensis]
MKHIFIVAITAILVTGFSTSAFAHSHFHGSSPADGDVVTDPPHEIILEFNGQIEQGSFIDVTTTEGEAVEIQDIIIGEGTLTGTFAEPPVNDEYHVTWSIISADGHPLEGEFSFTVDAEVPESVEEGESAKTETIEEEDTEEPSVIETVENEESMESAEQPTEDAEEEGSSSVLVIVIVALVAIVVVGIFLLSKRRK